MTSTRTIRALAHLLLVVGAVAVGVLLFVTPAAAKAPSVAAWWNAANKGGDAPNPPAPPDVKSGDLYVAGSNPTAQPFNPPSGPPPVPGLPPLPAPIPHPPSSGLPSAPTSAPAVPHHPADAAARPLAKQQNPSAGDQAISGLEFTVPRGALIGSLTLAIDGSAPPQTSVVACRALQNFMSEENGTWSDVPRYTCANQAAGEIKNGKLVFEQIGSLAAGTSLDIVLVPGPLDRIVLRKPGSSALDVSGGGGSAPPPLSGPPPGTGHGGNTGHGSNPGNTSHGGGGFVPPNSGTGGTGGGIGGTGGTGGGFTPPNGGGSVTPPNTPKLNNTGSAPVAAPRPGGGGATSAPAPVPAAETTSAGPLTTPGRRIAAAGVIAAEVLGFLLLRRTRRAPAPAAVPTLGGRLRPPDTASAAAAAPVERGVGRFTRVRGSAVSKL